MLFGRHAKPGLIHGLAQHGSTAPLSRGVLRRQWTRCKTWHSEESPDTIRDWQRIAQEAKLVLVRWTIHKPLYWGESMGILGSSEGLGNWSQSPGSIVRMSWSQGDNWKADVWLPCGDLEYKYLVMSEDGEFKEWQQVPQNKTISLSPQVLVYDVVDSWDSPDRLSLSTVAAPPLPKSADTAPSHAATTSGGETAAAQQKERAPRGADDQCREQGSGAAAERDGVHGARGGGESSSGNKGVAGVYSSSSSSNSSSNSSSSNSIGRSKGSGLGAGSSGWGSIGSGFNSSNGSSSRSNSNESGGDVGENRHVRGFQAGENGVPPGSMRHLQDQHQQHRNQSAGSDGVLHEGSSSSSSSSSQPGDFLIGSQAIASGRNSSSSRSSNNGGSPASHSSSNGWRGTREGADGDGATNIYGSSHRRTAVGSSNGSNGGGGADESDVPRSRSSKVLAADSTRGSLGSRFQDLTIAELQHESKRRNLPCFGNRTALLRRLNEAVGQDRIGVLG